MSANLKSLVKITALLEFAKTQKDSVSDPQWVRNIEIENIEVLGRLLVYLGKVAKDMPASYSTGDSAEGQAITKEMVTTALEEIKLILDSEGV